VNFDCSGLTLYAWGVAGVRLSHYSVAQASETRNVTNEAWLPGDLLFFHSPISHVSIYLGNGQHIHAPQEGENVKIGSFTRSHVVQVGRPRI
jgi:cell wall-associated NlpC family hydrolase